MSYLDKHKSRINATGSSIGEAIKKSTINYINDSFEDSPYYKVVQVNGVDKGVRITDMTSLIRSLNFRTVLFSQKYMYLQPNDSVNLGDMVVYNDLDWMVADFNSDDPIYPKAKIEKCNNSISVVTGNTEVISGYDDMDRPILSGNILTNTLPCIISESNGNGSFSGEINVATDKVMITVQYNPTSKYIKENDEYTFYGRTYKVVSIDFSSLYDGVGMIHLNAVRVT